jgi:CBS domain containing-hemolysin-like protein
MACFALASVSAWLSASEIALFSLSRFQLRSLKERFRASHRKIKRLLSDPTGLLITLLVINEMVNVGLSSIIAEVVARAPKPGIVERLPIPAWMLSSVLSLLVSTPIVLMLCDITPKIVGARGSRLIAPATAGPLTALYDTFRPVRFVLSKLVARVASWTAPSPQAGASTEASGDARSIQGVHAAGDSQSDDAGAGAKGEEGAEQKLLREADFLMLLEEGHKEGAVQQAELQLIKNVFELDDTTVAEVFTPLPQVQTLNERTTLRSALNMMRSQKHSRIPVTAAASHGSRRQVVGVLYAKDLLRARLEPEQMGQTVESLMRRPLFVSHTLRLNSLFRRFKQQKTHMAVVQGAHGDALGIITMSDVLETLFEDVLPDAEDAGYDDDSDLDEDRDWEGA